MLMLESARSLENQVFLKKKSNSFPKKNHYKITHPDEKTLAFMTIKFFDVIDYAIEDLALNKITDFLYELSVKIQKNYKKYMIVGN